MKRNPPKQDSPAKLAAKRARRIKRQERLKQAALRVTRGYAMSVVRQGKQLEFANMFNDELMAKLEIIEDHYGKEELKKLFEEKQPIGEKNDQVQPTDSIEESTSDPE